MRNLASEQITGCEILNNDYYNLEPLHPLDQDINSSYYLPYIIYNFTSKKLV